ncbi:MAG: alpha-L-fucosidase, partial [Bacteroidales bacterium]
MKKLILIVFAFHCFLSGYTQPINNTTQNDKMSWWRDARFGMFIHWGLYAVPAG